MSFRDAVDAKDMDAVEAMLADDVVFKSPVAHKPYEGKAITGAILRAVAEVFEDLTYVREIRDPNGVNDAFMFEAKVNGLDITGCDFLVYNDAGKIVEFMVMVRPLKAAHALAERMGERFGQIMEDAQRAQQA